MVITVAGREAFMRDLLLDDGATSIKRYIILTWGRCKWEKNTRAQKIKIGDEQTMDLSK